VLRPAAMKPSWLLASAALAMACGAKPKPIVEAPVKEPVVAKPQPKPRPPEDIFLEECRQGLSSARAILPKILAGPEERTVDNTLLSYNELLTGLGESAAMAGLMSEVHPDATIREAARTCEQDVSTFSTELQLNRPLYDAINKVDLRTADAEAKRFVELTLRDYRRAGVDRDEATRARLTQIDDELTKLGQQFSKTIADDVRFIEVDDASQLAGLPQDFIDAHKPGPNGKIKITTDYPDYNPFMAYADNDDLRKQLYIMFRSRGDENSEQIKANRTKDNEALLADILGLRAEKALLLGYKNWGDYITEDKMIGSAKKAADFIDRVWKLGNRRAKKDYSELLRQLRSTDRGAREVADWQKTWLETKVKKAKYEVDAAEVRKYFPYDAVLAGLLDITATIYDIQYVAVADAKPWHESVKVFDVISGSGNKPLGRIYLDMHPREGKYKHAAQFTLKDGVDGVQLPEGVLVCNFPDPTTAAGGPALMEHDDVVTMFHEFGHLMHHVLGGHHRWIRQSGVATEFDFVEAPSQMFEEWAWSHETLQRFAKHHETGEVIPKELVAKMRKADKFGLGTQTVQQMFYAALSLRFHTVDPDKLDQLEEVKRLQKKYTPFAYVDGTKFHASFGHLVGYSAMYYTYMWSLVIAKDMLTPFQKKGLMNTQATFAYRDKVISPGGTRDAADLVKDFLGRDYSFRAFDKYLSE
jgi:thimet oligopeptidase